MGIGIGLFVLAMAFIIAGVAMSLRAWSVHRKTGVAFLSFAPIWRAGEFLHPDGVRMWQRGARISLIGLGQLTLATWFLTVGLGKLVS